MPRPELKRPTWAEISLDSLAFNLKSARNFIGNDVACMAVVKANAYGHGAVECSKRLVAEGVEWLGVALVEEGVELRSAGIDTPILCLGGFWRDQIDLALRHDLSPVVFSIEAAEHLDRISADRGVVTDVHAKIDTGMGRLGVRFDEALAFAESLRKLGNIRVNGIMTHFAAADDLGAVEFTNEQMRRFDAVVEIFRERGFDPVHIDLANSPGAVIHPRSRGNMVRLGGILYGLGDDVLPKGVDKPELRPVFSLYTEIAQVKRVPAGESLGYGRTFFTKRDSLIATVPIGYHDGYRRNLSNKTSAIVNGKPAPVVGIISMDWTIIDVTDIPDIEPGVHVTLIGESGDVKITAEQLAREIGTISYEVTCGIGSRVPRMYK